MSHKIHVLFNSQGWLNKKLALLTLLMGLLLLSFVGVESASADIFRIGFVSAIQNSSGTCNISARVYAQPENRGKSIYATYCYGGDCIQNNNGWHNKGKYQGSHTNVKMLDREPSVSHTYRFKVQDQNGNWDERTVTLRLDKNCKQKEWYQW
jgi:hypothetical protein